MSKRTLIALDARLYAGSMTGDSTYWTGLIDALLATESEFDFALCSNRPAPELAPARVREAWVEVPGKSGKVWSLIQWPLALRQLRPSLAHTQYTLPFGLPCPGITTIHDVSFRIGPEWFPPRDRLLLERSIASSVRRASAIVTVSHTSKGEIEHFYPSATGKTHAIWNGPNQKLGIVDDAVGIVKQELGIDRPYVLSVSTQWPRKNMQLAIDAMARLPDSIPHRLVLTGKSGWGELKDHPRVVRPGYVSERDLSALYSAADLYLCPSLHEGFGIPLVEAFQLGCPVLCSTGGALPEIAGGAAEVQDGFDPQQWSDVIRSLLADSSKLESMREQGRRRAKDFSWERSAAQHLDVYRRVLD